MPSPKNRFLLFAVVAILAVALVVALQTSRRPTKGAQAQQERASTPGAAGAERIELHSPTSEGHVGSVRAESGGEPPATEKVLARVEGEIVVRGGASPEHFTRMGILVVSASGSGAKATITEDGRYTAELRLLEPDCRQPLTVQLDTDAGQRFRKSVVLQPTPSATSGAEYAGKIDFALTDRCVVKGSVIDELGQPLGSVSVTLVQLSNVDHSYQVAAETTSAADGRFWVEAPLAAELLLAVVDREHRPDARQVSTLEGGELDVGSIPLQLGEVIQGTAVWNEAERARGGFKIQGRCRSKRVILLGSGDEAFSLSYDGTTLRHYLVYATVDGDGFRLPGLERDAYGVDLGRREGYCRLPGLRNESVQVSAPAVIVLDPKDPQIWIDVRDARSGRAVFASLRAVGAFGEFPFQTDRQGGVLVFCAPDTDYQIFVEAPGYDRGVIDVRSPGMNGHVEHLVRLEPMPTGNLVLTLSEPWSGRGRVTLKAQGDDRTSSREVDVQAGRVQLEALLPGFYEGQLDLWGGGALRGGSADEDLRVPFDVRVKASETAERLVRLE